MAAVLTYYNDKGLQSLANELRALPKETEILEIKLSDIPQNKNFNPYLKSWLKFYDITFSISYASLKEDEFFASCQALFKELHSVKNINALKIKITNISDQANSLMEKKFSFDAFNVILTHFNDPADSETDTDGEGSAADVQNPQIGEYSGSDNENCDPDPEALRKYVQESYARMAQSESSCDKGKAGELSYYSSTKTNALVKIPLDPSHELNDEDLAYIMNLLLEGNILFSIEASHLKNDVFSAEVILFFHNLVGMLDTLEQKEISVQFEGELDASMKEVIRASFPKIIKIEEKCDARIMQRRTDSQASYSGADRPAENGDWVSTFSKDFLQDENAPVGNNEDSDDKNKTGYILTIDEDTKGNTWNLQGKENSYYVYIIAVPEAKDLQSLQDKIKEFEYYILLSPLLTEEEAKRILQQFPLEKVHGFNHLKEGCDLEKEKEALGDLVEELESPDDVLSEDYYRLRMVIYYWGELIVQCQGKIGNKGHFFGEFWEAHDCIEEHNRYDEATAEKMRESQERYDKGKSKCSDDSDSHPQKVKVFESLDNANGYLKKRKYREEDNILYVKVEKELEMDDSQQEISKTLPQKGEELTLLNNHCLFFFDSYENRRYYQKIFVSPLKYEFKYI